MKNSRRDFLYRAGLSAFSAPLILSTLDSCSSKSGENKKENLNSEQIKDFGIQLWTVKEDMAKDPKSVLKKLAEYGYTHVESFDSEKGIFWGMSAKDFKSYLTDIGLTIRSSHINSDFTTKAEKESEFKKLLEDAASIGMQYLSNPFPGPLKTIDEWKKVVEGLNKQGEISKSFGIKTGYHNHHFEFLPTSDGSIPEELLLKGTDPNLVDFELDLYWIVKAGQDAEKWMNDYKGRFKLVHIKDLYPAEKVAEIEKTEKTDDPFWPLGASTVLGKGRIDFSKLLKVAKETGVEQFIVEQERFDNSAPLDDAKTDAEYMKALKLA